MFFKGLFSKTAQQLAEKGERLYADGHFADARHILSDALDKNAKEGGDVALASKCKATMAACGNQMAELNIAEAGAAFRSGAMDKADEYARFALQLAEDPKIREMAESMIGKISTTEPLTVSSAKVSAGHNCSSCSSSHGQISESEQLFPNHLTDEELFHLHISALPGDLPQRYAGLGEDFASTYLLAHGEAADKALNDFKRLLSQHENDIILYECALLEHRAQRLDICESLLDRAMGLNPANPLCNLTLAQLYIETRRPVEAINLLQRMVDGEILKEQALMMLADVRVMTGDTEGALNLLGTTLEHPQLKKPSAERLVHILTAAGREQEAAFIAKNYLKGCH